MRDRFVSLISLFVLMVVGAAMFVIYAQSFEAEAHEPVDQPCPTCPVCPPEGYLLVELADSPTETQQTIEAGLETIEAAQEATK